MRASRDRNRENSLLTVGQWTHAERDTSGFTFGTITDRVCTVVESHIHSDLDLLTAEDLSLSVSTGFFLSLAPTVTRSYWSEKGEVQDTASTASFSERVYNSACVTDCSCGQN